MHELCSFQLDHRADHIAHTFHYNYRNKNQICDWDINEIPINIWRLLTHYYHQLVNAIDYLNGSFSQLFLSIVWFRLLFSKVLHFEATKSASTVQNEIDTHRNGNSPLDYQKYLIVNKISTAKKLIKKKHKNCVYECCGHFNGHISMRWWTFFGDIFFFFFGVLQSLPLFCHCTYFFTDAIIITLLVMFSLFVCCSININALKLIVFQ